MRRGLLLFVFAFAGCASVPHAPSPTKIAKTAFAVVRPGTPWPAARKPCALARVSFECAPGFSVFSSAEAGSPAVLVEGGFGASSRWSELPVVGEARDRARVSVEAEG